MTTAPVELPAVLVPVFAMPRGAVAYRGSYGGRGSGKTRSFAKMTAIWAVMMADAGLRGVILCGREFQNSLDDSSMAEIKTAIQSDDWLVAQFDIGEKYIRTKCRRISYLFAGLRHNLDSIKSKARVLLTWIDEAENVSEVAWRKLVATVMREEGSEIWVTWNPESEESATHQRFRKHYDPNRMVIVECNWSDNPWFPDGLNEERLADLKYRTDTYGHVWEGEFLTLTEAQVFNGRYSVEEFEPASNWDGPYFGGDFGYSQDPTAAIKAWISGKVLYIEKEAGGRKIEVNDIANRVLSAMPEAGAHDMRWDSARPDLVSLVRRNGLPKASGAAKGKGSVEAGVAFIRSFDRVVIHPRCTETAREFRLYSWKKDERSGAILPVLVDANNHWIDALRYALEPIMRRAKVSMAWV